VSWQQKAKRSKITHVCTVSSASGKKDVEKFNTRAEGKLGAAEAEDAATLAFSIA
jgi:hypothetical protein